MAESSERLSELLRDSPDDIEARSHALEAHPPQDVLRAALELHGARALVSTAFGSTGLCLLHMAQTIDPGVRAYYVDTGFAFPETQTLASRWVDERRLNLLRVLPLETPAEQAATHGDALWARDPDRC